jgi:hypothetical protein
VYNYTLKCATCRGSSVPTWLGRRKQTLRTPSGLQPPVHDCQSCTTVSGLVFGVGCLAFASAPIAALPTALCANFLWRASACMPVGGDTDIAPVSPRCCCTLHAKQTMPSLRGSDDDDRREQVSLCCSYDSHILRTVPLQLHGPALPCLVRGCQKSVDDCR